MADEAYYRWVAAGKPYTRARPSLQLRDLFRSHGYTVYDYPDERHQTADPAEDHTAYSETGWPITSAEWVGHAIDVMPRAGLPDLATLARQIIADKDAGVRGTEAIKYINWTDENGDCWQTSWKPTKRTVRSTDKGHIHISVRSDMDTSDAVSASGWDPVEAIMSLTTEEHTWLYNLYLGMFSGGSSCGEKVTAPSGATGNALFTKLDYQNGLLRQIAASSGAVVQALQAQSAKLDEILAAALDDGDTTVVLPPDAIAELQELKAQIDALVNAEKAAAAATTAALS